jgi:hypothetical protein
MGAILKSGIGVIRSVSPKVKSKGIAKSKANIAKNIGQIKRYQDEREELIEYNLKKAKEGEKSIYGTVEETEKELEKLRAEKKKFPSKDMRKFDEGLTFEVTPEYKKGGRVKKNKGGLMRGIPKIAIKGY